MSNERECQCGQAHGGACNTEFQYAVKVVCGRAVANSKTGTTPVALGQYWTAINIHNPSKCAGANFRWKVAVGNSGAPGLITAYRTVRELRPDNALEIDCQQVMNALLPSVLGFVKGYVVIESDIELDVVAVYSTAQSVTAPVNSFHTERVEPRCVPVCEELILPLHTGIAAWQTVPPTPGQLGPVQIVNPIPWTTPPPFGSSWVSQSSADGGSGAATNRRYELCFDLCYGFTPPAAFQIQILADGFPSPVFLNNVQIGVVGPSGWTTPTNISVPANLFRPGRNCFRVDVTNTSTGPNPTGFALAGILRIARGKCPCSPLPLLPPRRSVGLPAAIDETPAIDEIAADDEITADESEASPAGASMVSRKGSKKSAGRKRASKKAAMK